ncbi:hypothetical protein MMC13_005973 [Lambiella insularis]|nr:hypothetical protein [Lambiella insularis]
MATQKKTHKLLTSRKARRTAIAKARRQLGISEGMSLRRPPRPNPNASQLTPPAHRAASTAQLAHLTRLKAARAHNCDLAVRLARAGKISPSTSAAVRARYTKKAQAARAQSAKHLQESRGGALLGELPWEKMTEEQMVREDERRESLGLVGAEGAGEEDGEEWEEGDEEQEEEEGEEFEEDDENSGGESGHGGRHMHSRLVIRTKDPRDDDDEKEGRYMQPELVIRTKKDR